MVNIGSEWSSLLLCQSARIPSRSARFRIHVRGQREATSSLPRRSRTFVGASARGPLAQFVHEFQKLAGARFLRPARQLLAAASNSSQSDCLCLRRPFGHAHQVGWLDSPVGHSDDPRARHVVRRRATNRKYAITSRISVLPRIDSPRIDEWNLLATQHLDEIRAVRVLAIEHRAASPLDARRVQSIDFARDPFGLIFRRPNSAMRILSPAGFRGQSSGRRE